MRFTDHAAYASWVLHDAHVTWPAVPPDHVALIDVIYGLLTTAGAVGCAAMGLFGRPLRGSLPAGLAGRARSAMRVRRGLHSGHIGDYIAWWSAGASVLGAVCLLALT